MEHIRNGNRSSLTFYTYCHASIRSNGAGANATAATACATKSEWEYYHSRDSGFYSAVAHAHQPAACAATSCHSGRWNDYIAERAGDDCIGSIPNARNAGNGHFDATASTTRAYGDNGRAYACQPHR